MSTSLEEWFSRLAQVSGDSRKELVCLARKHCWDMDFFANEIACDGGDSRPLLEVVGPKDVAALLRAWRTEFGSDAFPVRGGTRRSPTEFQNGGKARSEKFWQEKDGFEPARNSHPYYSNSGLMSQVLHHDTGVESRSYQRGRRHFAQSPIVDALPHGAPPAVGQREVPEIGFLKSRRHNQDEGLSSPKREKNPISGVVRAVSSPSKAHEFEAGRTRERRHIDVNMQSSKPGSPIAQKEPDTGVHRQRRHYNFPTSVCLEQLPSYENDFESYGSSRAVSSITRSQAGRHYEKRHTDVNMETKQGSPIATQEPDLGVHRQKKHFAPPFRLSNPAGMDGSVGCENFLDQRDSRQSSPGAVYRSPLSTSGRVQEALLGAYAIAVSPDGGSVYVAGTFGLARFDTTTLELRAKEECGAGRAVPAGQSQGYADVAAGQNSVICADIEGTLYAHHPLSCQLLAERAYEPSVFQSNQRLVGGKMRTCSAGITGLEGGFGGASRIAVSGSAVYLGSRDGVVTAMSPHTLSVLTRTQLSEGPQAVGIRAVYMPPSQERIYAAVLSAVHVLTPGLAPVAKLRGGPRVPVFGHLCSITESRDARLAFLGDTGGPSVHVWNIENWQWLSRIELASGGGAATHLAAALGGELLYASTDHGRFLAFDIENSPPQCLEQGVGGGPLAVSEAHPDHVIVLVEGRLVLRRADRWLTHPHIVPRPGALIQ